MRKNSIHAILALSLLALVLACCPSLRSFAEPSTKQSTTESVNEVEVASSEKGEGNTSCCITGELAGKCAPLNEPGERCLKYASGYCSEDAECVQPRCVGGKCSGAHSSGLTCTEDSCQPEHPARCVVKEFIDRQNKTHRQGWCTVSYRDDQVDKGEVGAPCDDESSCSKPGLFCWLERGTCALRRDISGTVGAPCILWDIGGHPRCQQNERYCHEAKCRLAKDLIGKQVPRAEWGEQCKDNSTCPRETTRCSVAAQKSTCAKDGDGKLCKRDEECASTERFFCSDQGTCVSGNCDEGVCDDSLGDECIPDDQSGHAYCGSFKVCTPEGTCVRSKQSQEMGMPQCEQPGTCGMTTEKISCKNYICTRDYKGPLMQGCTPGSSDECWKRVCLKDGKCEFVDGITKESTCNSHAECKLRGYPDFCAANPREPLCPGNSQEQKTFRETRGDLSRGSAEKARMGLESLESAEEIQRGLPPSIAVSEMSKVTPSFVWGKSDAKATLALFQDLSCGQCARVHRESFSALQTKYIDSGRLKLAFYEFPLIMSNTKDVERHYAALCAGEQDKYRDFVEQLYGNFKEYHNKGHEHYVRGISGLDLAKWKSCMANTAPLAAKVKQQKALGQKLGVSGTPTLLLNGEDTSNFKEALLAAVAEATK